MGLLDDLQDLAPYEVTATPIVLSIDGDEVPGIPQVLSNCYIDDESRMVRDNTGTKVVSSMTILVLEYNNKIDALAWRFTIPSEFSEPNTDLVAIAVKTISDEDGACYNEVVLP